MNFLMGYLSMASGFAGPLMKFIRRRWIRTLIWTLALCLVVFFYGDAIRLRRWQPLDSDGTREGVCAVILLTWAVYNIVMLVRDRQKNGKLIEAVTAGDHGLNRSDVSAQEIELIRGRLQDAMKQMRQVVGGHRGYAYHLPWYILIGPPGSGKTTALLNSGLKFPFMEASRREPLHGVGGTRNCDWWFTEEAILLDTAGRYTSQDSDPEMDRQGWAGFLGLLKTYRPLQPINGVIVALSVEDVATRNPQERLANAQAIRQRLGELTRTFQSRFPVYILLTKADLLAGFVQFFDAFSRSDREQVWGMTFPLDDGKASTQAAYSRFDAEYDLLLTRMNAIVLERLQQESDIQRRGLIYGFPLQVATLKEPLHEILDEIFTTSKFDERPLLRGLYFVSGTQQGAPIDRLMHAMASTFGMEMPRQTAFSGQEKSYFLTRLLNDVVFEEANVVAVDPIGRRRMATTRRLAAGAAAILVATLLGIWALAYARNAELIRSTDRHIARYKQMVVGIPTTDIIDDDFLRILAPLDMLRDGPPELHRQTQSLFAHVGMAQSSKLQSQYGSAYARALNSLLLPRVLVVIQKKLRNGKEDDFDFKVQALKIYLGLGGQADLDRDLTRRWMHAEWVNRYPGEANKHVRERLDLHFATLVDQAYQPIGLDASLVGDVRKQLQKVPLAARVYALLRDSEQAHRLPVWTVEDKAGALVDRAFTRVSNTPMTEGIPGFYTREGFLSVLVPGLRSAAESVSREQSAYNGNGGSSQPVDDIANQALDLYRGDFGVKWNALVNDLRIRKLTDMQQSILVLTALSGPDSVLTKLLLAIVHDTDLAAPTSPTGKDPSMQKLHALIGSAPAVSSPEQPFAALRAAMQSVNGSPSQIDDLMRTVNELYEQVSRAASLSEVSVGAAEAESGLSNANQKLISQSRLVPPPVDVWLSDLSASVASVTSGTARNAISRTWSATGQRFCLQATRGKYPFSRNGSGEISIDDFTKLFGPGGTLDVFFTENLKSFVNTTRHPWRWQYSAAQSVSSAFLRQFEHADAIRQAFFNNAGLSFHYEISPDRLDPNANAVTLDIGGQTLRYAHGPILPTTFVWPAGSTNGARLSVEPSSAGGVLAVQGVWAPFRLFDNGSVVVEGGDRLSVTFALGSHALSLNVKSDAVLNPFTLRDLQAFRCPGAL